MADRYWVGITGTWNASNTAVWSIADPLSLPTASCSGTTLTTTGSPALVVGMTVWSSTFVSLGTITGGSGNTWTVSVGGSYASQTMIAATTGASVPTITDNVFFRRVSSNYTVTLTGSLACNSFNKVGTTITFTSSGTLSIMGSFSLSGTTTWSATGTLTFYSTTTGNTISTGGATLPCNVVFDGIGGVWTLTSAFSSSSGVTLTNGSFNTAGLAFTAGLFSSSNINTRSISLGSSLVTLTNSSGTPWFLTLTTGLTFSAGTSEIRYSGALLGTTFAGGGLTYNNVNFTSTAQTSNTISGANTFNTLSIAARTGGAINTITLSNDQTISTLTLSAGSSATSRLFLRSNVIGTTQTLTVSTFTATTDIDFRDITIAGAAAPISGTRFGDCKGNTGIAFDAAKTVYWNLENASNWASTGWALSAGGAVAANNFPLAQDTAIFTLAAPITGTITIPANYNIGTIDMSARTSSSMLLATGTTTPSIYGNWINGTANTISGTGMLTFAGRGSQTITSAGKFFTQPFTFNSPGGTVTLQDSFTTSSTSPSVITLAAGTFNMNNFNVTTSSISLVNGFSITATFGNATLAMGSGTMTLVGSGSSTIAFNNPNACTVTGTGTISATGSGSKQFVGGGGTYPTINQGGAGRLTITGSNTFANITNTYSATGATIVTFIGGTTNIFAEFNLTGSVGKVCTLNTTNLLQAILIKSTAWNVGANSTDGGNNTGLSFTAGGGIDYLAISYINGQNAISTNYLGNFFAFF